MSSLKLRKEKNCLNCGHTVEESYCTHCGQENIELKENAWHMIVHAVADYFHFEHKFFGTLKPLLFKPGKLTAEYVAGKRASFLHPIKLYIFISIVFFIVVFSGTTVNVGDNKVYNTSSINDSTELVDMTNMLKYIPTPQSQKDSLLAQEERALEKKAMNWQVVSG